MHSSDGGRIGNNYETFYYTYFHYTYKKQSLFASGNGNKDYFFQLGIDVTDR